MREPKECPVLTLEDLDSPSEPHITYQFGNFVSFLVRCIFLVFLLLLFYSMVDLDSTVIMAKRIVNYIVMYMSFFLCIMSVLVSYK